MIRRRADVLDDVASVDWRHARALLPGQSVRLTPGGPVVVVDYVSTVDGNTVAVWPRWVPSPVYLHPKDRVEVVS